jgi:hypothetical protein
MHMFYILLFVPLSFFFWPLCCLFFDLRILITPLVSSPSSCKEETSDVNVLDLISYDCVIFRYKT